MKMEAVLTMLLHLIGSEEKYNSAEITCAQSITAILRLQKLGMKVLPGDGGPSSGGGPSRGGGSSRGSGGGGRRGLCPYILYSNFLIMVRVNVGLSLGFKIKTIYIIGHINK